jgi:hypothetical protein
MIYVRDLNAAAQHRRPLRLLVAHVELAFELVDPFLGRLMRRVQYWRWHGLFAASAVRVQQIYGVPGSRHWTLC